MANGIAIVTGYLGECPHAAVHLANVAEYCERRSYCLVANYVPTCPEFERPPFWWKPFNLLRVVDHYEWLLWVDTDVLLINMQTRIENILNKDKCFVMAKGGRWAVAHMLVNCKHEKTRNLLVTWWESFHKSLAAENENCIHNDAAAFDYYVAAMSDGLIEEMDERLYSWHPVCGPPESLSKEVLFLHFPGRPPIEQYNCMKQYVGAIR